MRTPEIRQISKDARGESYSVLLPDGRELVLIHTKRGMYRGGHYHSKPEVSLMLSGKMRYIKKASGQEIEFEQETGDLLRNEAGEPHLAYAIEEGWLVDWKLGARAGETVTVNVPEYRKFVERQKP